VAEDQDRFLSKNCLTGLYLNILFTDGYGFALNTTQILAQDTINNKSIGLLTRQNSILRGIIYNLQNAFVKSHETVSRCI